jgi:hypothetical protein
VTQSDHCAPRGSRRRSNSTHPASTHPATSRSGNRRPYPTASTTTRVSVAKPGSVNARSRSRGLGSTPTPATVWTAGPVPIEFDAAWPTPIISKIVSAFSKPCGQVVLLPWPTSEPNSGGRPRLAPVDAGTVTDHAPGAEPDTELADALATIEALDRTGRGVRIATDPTLTRPVSRLFWADLVSAPHDLSATVSPSPEPGVGNGVLDSAEAVPADTDLIITRLRPERSGDHTSDLVALLAARLLRAGGILAVLTHCDWSDGELIDPTGAVIASAQNADLLYLQHIIALHTPVRDGRISAVPDGPTGEREVRARHRAAVRGLPASHQRIHSDVLIFTQPRDHQPPHVALAHAAFQPEVIQ